MSVLNLIVLPNYYGMPLTVIVGLPPMVGVFNAMQGGITVLLGYFIQGKYQESTSHCGIRLRRKLINKLR